MKKRKPKLTHKQRKLVKHLPTADSVSDAGRKAGYGTAQATHKALKAIEKKMRGVLDRHGLTDDHLAEKCLKPALEAKETKFFAHEGRIVQTRSVISWETRLRALDMAFKLKGAYPKNGDGSDGSGAQRVVIRLELSDRAEQRAVAAVISARRGGA